MMEEQGQPGEMNTVAEYNVLFDSVGINVCKLLLDDELTILWGNDNFYINSGFTKAEYQKLFPSIKAYYAGHGEEFHKIKNAFAAASKKAGRRAKVDCRRPLKNGGCAWINIDAVITGEVVDGSEVALAVYSDISDLTRLKAERDQLLEEKTRYFEWMMDEYVGNIYISDLETYELLFLNKTAAATLHTTKAEVTGKKCYEVIQGRTSPCPFCNNALLTEDDVYAWEFDNPNLKKTFMIRNRVINWQGRRSRIELSHDIRTPMNAIIGMTAIARANLHEPEKVNGCLGKINVSSMHLLRLINEVLDMSKIESGKVDLVLEDVSLPDVVDNIVSICRPMMVEKQQEFKVNIFNVRNEHVITDGDRLQQVFMNLLSNAIKYTPEGGKISLTINELKSELPTKGNYEFIFTDNGIGMPDEYMQHIFEPFARAKDESISKIQGTGLGLAITQNIVQMMNGTIEVQSRPGTGSIFTVSVPLELQLKEEQEHEELNGLPVLVVDDELAVCESAAMLLQELGMRGSWVLSGAEAVERVVEAHERCDDFYAVILDWKMPDMDGLETVRVIRRRVGAKVPIIIISAYDYSNIEKEFIDAGADAFISKPLFKSKMLHVLQLFCDTCKDTCDGEAVPELHKELAGKRVLLVEDNELNREIAVELLEMQGLQVESAENGKSAVELFVRSAPGYYDVVLMDIQMPVMDGYEATAAIRALPRQDAVRIPILALTANAFVTDVGKAKNAGMNDHITKPINLEVLFATLYKWLV